MDDSAQRIVHGAPFFALRATSRQVGYERYPNILYALCPNHTLIKPVIFKADGADFGSLNNQDNSFTDDRGKLSTQKGPLSQFDYLIDK